jgi:ABC-type amino acid transport substrate-binding protein
MRPFPRRAPRPARLAVLGRFALLALLGVLPAVAAASATLDRIKSTGTVRLAYREAARPFAFKEGDRVRGYSVELCERVADALRVRLALPRLDVRWRGVDAANRLDVIAKGEADIECGTTTITLGRMEQVDFSVPIFVDGGSVLVRADANLGRLADLKGRRIAVIVGTTTERALLTHLGTANAQAVMVPVKDIAEGLAALAAGTVDGVAGDRIVLAVQRSRLANAASYAFIADDFSYEPYALVVRRDDPDFRLAVNRALVALYRSGEIDTIFQRWFGELGQPGQLLHSMFYLQQFQD